MSTAVTEGTLSGTFYRREGAGPPVVLIHGVGLDHTMWDPQVRALAPSFDVLRYDLACHGKTVLTGDLIFLDDLVGQVVTLLDDLEVGRPVLLVGFSLGGLIARRFALHHPERVERLALLSTVFERTPEQKKAVKDRYWATYRGDMEQVARAAIDRWFPEDFRAGCPDEVEAVRHRLATNDWQHYLKAYGVFADGEADERHTLAAIRCPTLIATGELDPNSTPDMARAMVDILPDGRLKILPGLMHMANIQDPQQVNQVLLEFLQPALREGGG